MAIPSLHAVFGVFLAATGGMNIAAGEPGVGEALGTTADQTVEGVPLDAVDGQFLPLPPITRIIRHVARADGTQIATATSPPGKLIYSNTRGTFHYAPGANYLIADDLYTTAVNSCSLTSYNVRVTGGVENGTGAFTATVGLWTACPTIPYGGGGLLIPGTERTFEDLGDDQGVLHDLVVDVSNNPVPISPYIWIRVQFSTASAGWVAGAPAELGFSANQMGHPLTGCNTAFGGNLYAAFYAQIYTTESCATQFLAYSSFLSAGGGFFSGARVQVADDLNLIVDQCELSAYEVGARGTTGLFHMDVDLRLPGAVQPIPGTERTHSFIRGNGVLEIARFNFPPGIFLPRSIWVSWESRGSSSRHFNGNALVGCTRPGMYVFDGSSWNPTNESYGGLAFVNVYCRGDAPDVVQCPNGEIGWVDPPQDTVDARQPHELYDAAHPQGIDRLIATLPSGGENPTCWSLCEADSRGSPNRITAVTDNGNGTHTLSLTRPITAGAITEASYLNPSGCVMDTGFFISQPGDVNADNTSNARDILSLIDCCLNHRCTPPFGDYSCDIDHSGGINGQDLVHLINVLNGAGPFDRWYGTRPSTGPCQSGCGGFVGIPCHNGAFCKFPQGTCNHADIFGVCTERAQACPANFDPVCGCDGITHGNECEADRAGLSIDHRGACMP